MFINNIPKYGDNPKFGTPCLASSLLLIFRTCTFNIFHSDLRCPFISLHSFISPHSTIGELRSFLGLCNYSRDYVQNYSRIAEPLSGLLKNPGKLNNKQFKSIKIEWNDERKETF